MALPQVLDPITDSLTKSTRKINFSFGDPPKFATLDLDFSKVPSWLDISQLSIKIYSPNGAGNLVERAGGLLSQMSSDSAEESEAYAKYYSVQTMTTELGFYSSPFGRKLGGFAATLTEGTTKVSVQVNDPKDEANYELSFLFDA